MEIEIVAFGIAKDIIKSRSLQLEVPEYITIEDLKTKLVDQYPDFDKLASLNFAVNEDYQDDSYQIKAGEKVVIIPPVSGG